MPPLPPPLLLRATLLGVALAGCRHDAQADGSVAEARVRIAALLPDPAGVPDDRGEWVILRNEGEGSADLGGWRLASGGDPGFVVPRRTVIPAGGSLTLARSTDRGRNGGVDARIALTGITLGNRADWLSLRNAAGRTVDSVAWRSPRAGEVLRPTAAPPRPRGDSATAAPGAAALEVRVLDVGQGDAIVVRSGSSTAIIDGGPDPAILAHHLEGLGIGQDATIDLVVLTHAHADHYQGLRELFRSRRRIAVRYFLDNGDPSPNAGVRRLRDSVAARVRRGETIYRDGDDPCGDGRPICTFTLRGGARIHVLRPLPRGDGQNDRSIAVKLVAPDSTFTMLLAGDAQHAGNAWLQRRFARAPGLDVDVIKANHHGSCDGLSRRWLALTSPAWSVASLGAMNDYGHVHARTKSLLRAARVPWYRTDRNGTITIRVPGANGAPFAVTPERGGASEDGRSDRPARCE